MNVLTQLAFLAFVFVAITTATEYQQCANKKDPINLRVKDCEKLPCDLVQGTDVVMEMDFLVDRDTKTLRPEVKADALGMTVDYPIQQQDACKSLTNGECPLDEGEELTYRLEMNISPQYPTIDLVVQLSLIDEHGGIFGCFRLPGRVVAPRS